MRDRILLGGVALLILAMLAGCSSFFTPEDGFDADSISKAQKIVVQDAAGNEKTVLEDEADIDAFVEAVNVEGWRFAELPEGLTEAGSFALWQTETVTALIGRSEAKPQELCTFRVYRDGNYMTIETELIDIPFSIPQETADYLRTLLA